MATAMGAKTKVIVILVGVIILFFFFVPVMSGLPPSEACGVFDACARISHYSSISYWFFRYGAIYARQFGYRLVF